MDLLEKKNGTTGQSTKKGNLIRSRFMNVGWILYRSEIRENWTFRFLHSSQKWHKLIQSGTKFTLLLKLLLWNVSGVTRRQISLVVYNLNKLICNYSLCLPFFSKVKNVVFLPAGNFSSTIQQHLILQTFFSLLNQSQHTCHITADRILKCHTNYFSMMPTFVSASPSVTEFLQKTTEEEVKSR